MNLLQNALHTLLRQHPTNPSPQGSGNEQMSTRKALPMAPYAQPMGGGAMPQQQMQQPLQVQQGQGMQPFGPSQEDDYTAQIAAQPVDYNTHQVSLHGGIQQGGSLRGGQIQQDPQAHLRRLLGF